MLVICLCTIAKSMSFPAHGRTTLLYKDCLSLLLGHLIWCNNIHLLRHLVKLVANLQPQLPLKFL